jgi:uncharacterized protein (DUF2062 family)
MLRKYFTNISRKYREKEHPWYMAPLTYVMNHPVYFSVSRRTISRGVWIGVFVAFLPIPMQMGVAALLALIARVNTPVAVLGVWVTNPLTMWPLFYLAYRLGAALLHVPIEPWPEDSNFLGALQGMGIIWEATLYGGVILGLSLATASYIAVSSIWSISAAIRYRERTLKRRLRRRKAEKTDPAEPGTNLD